MVLAHWKNRPRLNMLLHLDTLFWYQGIQSFLLLFNAASLTEK